MYVQAGVYYNMHACLYACEWESVFTLSHEKNFFFYTLAGLEFVAHGNLPASAYQVPGPTMPNRQLWYQLYTDI